MPTYGLPGAPTTPGRARTVGLVAIAALAVVLLVAQLASAGTSSDTMRLTVRAGAVGDGITPGADVRLRGVTVGSVESVAPADRGDQVIIGLSVRRSSAQGLTDALNVSYAPANLFGISSLVLEPGNGGAALADGATIDVTGAGRAVDATMSTLLRQLSELTDSALTPELTDVLKKLGDNAHSFGPLLKSIVSISRSVAETQKYPIPFLIDQYAEFMSGSSVLGDGIIKLIDRVYNIEVLRKERAQINDGVHLVADQAFPAISDVFNTANKQLHSYAGPLAVSLGQLARTVPDPTRSHAELIEIFDRLNKLFNDTSGGGRAIGVDVLVRGMPGVAVPLLGGAVPTQRGGQR